MVYVNPVIPPSPKFPKLSSSMDAVEYQESTTVTLDWTLRGLKQLFDSRWVCEAVPSVIEVLDFTASLISKGEAKSKVTKSIKFGGGRWQVSNEPITLRL